MHWPQPSSRADIENEPYDPLPGLLRVMIITTVITAGIQAVCQRGCSGERPAQTVPVPVQPIPPHMSPEPAPATDQLLAAYPNM